MKNKIKKIILVTILGLGLATSINLGKVDIKAAPVTCPANPEQQEGYAALFNVPEFSSLKFDTEIRSYSSEMGVRESATFNNVSKKYYQMYVEADTQYLRVEFQATRGSTGQEIRTPNRIKINSTLNKGETNVLLRVAYSNTPFNKNNPLPADVSFVEYCAPVTIVDKDAPINLDTDLRTGSITMQPEIKLEVNERAYVNSTFKLDRAYKATNINDLKTNIKNKFKTTLDIYNGGASSVNKLTGDDNYLKIDWERTKFILFNSKENKEVNEGGDYDEIRLRIATQAMKITPGEIQYASIKFVDPQHSTKKVYSPAVGKFLIRQEGSIKINKFEKVNEEVLKGYVNHQLTRTYRLTMEGEDGLYYPGDKAVRVAKVLEKFEVIGNDYLEKVKVEVDNSITQTDHQVYLKVTMEIKKYDNNPLTYKVSYPRFIDELGGMSTKEISDQITSARLHLPTVEDQVITIPTNSNEGVKQVNLGIDYGLIKQDLQAESIVIENVDQTIAYAQNKAFDNNAQPEKDKLFIKGLLPGEALIKLTIKDEAYTNEKSNEISFKVKVVKETKQINVVGYATKEVDLTSKLDSVIPANKELKLFDEENKEITDHDIFSYDDTTKKDDIEKI